MPSPQTFQSSFIKDGSFYAKKSFWENIKEMVVHLHFLKLQLQDFLVNRFLMGKKIPILKITTGLKPHKTFKKLYSIVEDY